ncbi:MAG: hypothetical protein IPP20_03445 [Gemmatimonadetes bacterium]|nr:hypothetical protein [Gemmatimonadota bacterium]
MSRRACPRRLASLHLSAARATALVVSLVSSGAWACRAPSPIAPVVSGAIDVHHVALALRFNIAERQAAGTATLTLSPTRDVERITLDGVQLTIEGVRLANGTPLAFTYDRAAHDDALAITLDRRYARDESLTVAIAYRTTWVNDSDPNNLGGSDGKGVRFFSPTTTEPRKRPQLWSMGMPEGNRYWFPANDAPDDHHTTDFSATVAAPLMVIATGVQESTTNNADGTRTFRWRSTTPHANHLTSFVIGEFVDVPQEADGVPLHSFGYPDEVDAVRASVVRLPDMMRYFVQLTGARYPYPRYSQVFVQDLGWGHGNVMASTLTENMVDDAPTHADYFYLWDGLEAEALAHQWFGAWITPRDWRHAWLARAFAHYLDALYSEHRNGRSEFLLWNRQGDQWTYFADWTNGARYTVVPAVGADSAAAEAMGNAPSVRGAMVLHMLRKELGEAQWQQLLRRFVATHGGTSVTTDDLQQAVEAVHGASMQWFFDQWVYGAGHPVFDVTQRYDASAQRLTLTVKQVQRPDSGSSRPAPLFQGNVDVAIDGTVRTVRLAAQGENVFSFLLPARPRLVHFDVEGSWIKEMTFEKSLDDLLYQLEHDRDVVAQRWAITQLVAHSRDTTTSSDARPRIRAALRQVVLGPAHWRLRLTALAQLQALLTPPDARVPLVLDDSTADMLRAVVARDSAWVRAQAYGFMGATRDTAWVPTYLAALSARSHVESFAAATALGASRSAHAYDALVAMIGVPSWKGENRLSALAGLKALGDPRAVKPAVAALADSTSPRWTLAIARWDFRIAAAELLASLGRGADGYSIVNARFERSLAEGDVNDMFSNMLLLSTLGDARAGRAIAALRARFSSDSNALAAVSFYERTLTSAAGAR